MGKLIKILTIVGLFLFTIGCSSAQNELDKVKNIPSNSSAQYINNYSNFDNDYIHNIIDLDTAIGKADNIIFGKVLIKEPYNSTGTYEIKIEVLENIKGKVDSNIIYLYEIISKVGPFYEEDFEHGKEVVLFMEYFANNLFPHPVYTTIYSPKTFIEIEKGNFIKGDHDFINEIRELEDLITYILLSPNYDEDTRMPVYTYDSPRDNNELMDLSDYIVHLHITEVVEETKYVKVVRADVKNQLKGTLESNRLFFLPFNITVDEEYIVFFRKYENDITLTTKDGSVISKTQVNDWEYLMNLFSILE